MSTLRTIAKAFNCKACGQALLSVITYQTQKLPAGLWVKAVVEADTVVGYDSAGRECHVHLPHRCKEWREYKSQEGAKERTEDQDPSLLS